MAVENPTLAVAWAKAKCFEGLLEKVEEVFKAGENKVKIGKILEVHKNKLNFDGNKQPKITYNSDFTIHKWMMMNNTSTVWW